MFALIRLLGVAVVALGITFLLSPKILKKYIAFWMQGKWLYIGSIISILFGIIFLSVASQCRLRVVMVILGIWSLIKGVILSIAGLEKARSMFLWWDKRSPIAIRLVAIIAIGIGILILYSI